jgi:hypothetical protein
MPSHSSQDLSSTIGRERATNPALLIPNVDDFIAFATADLPPAPAYFANVVRLNRCGAALLTSVVDTARRRLSVPDFARAMQPAAASATNAPLVLDARSASDFAAGHIPGSMSIPVGEACDPYTFAQWVRCCHVRVSSHRHWRCLALRSRHCWRCAPPTVCSLRLRDCIAAGRVGAAVATAAARVQRGS